MLFQKYSIKSSNKTGLSLPIVFFKEAELGE